MRRCKLKGCRGVSTSKLSDTRALVFSKLYPPANISMSSLGLELVFLAKLSPIEGLSRACMTESALWRIVDILTIMLTVPPAMSLMSTAFGRRLSRNAFLNDCRRLRDSLRDLVNDDRNSADHSRSCQAS